jgi:hypothetical protein
MSSINNAPGLTGRIHLAIYVDSRIAALPCDNELTIIK